MPQHPPWKLLRLFTPNEVAAAFAAMADPGAVGFTKPPLVQYGSRRAAKEAAGLKQHLDIPLRALSPGSEAHRALPAAILHIYAGLLHEAMQYATVAMRHPSVLPEARDAILDGIENKSVLRLLQYEAGVGCRPHVDPGLCTCLLLGSAGGLEVNDQAGNAAGLCVQDMPGNFRHDAADGAGDGEGGTRLDRLPGWHCPCASLTAAGEASASPDVLVMAGNMLEVVSQGFLPSVLHRVRSDWATTPADPAASATSQDDTSNGTHAPSPVRSNIIVELRPARPKRWYNATKGLPQSLDGLHASPS